MIVLCCGQEASPEWSGPLESLQSSVSVIEVPLDELAGNEKLLPLEKLRSWQRALAADATVLIDGDVYRDQLTAIATGAAPRLHGRTLGIFSRTWSWHPGEPAYFPMPSSFMHRTRSRLGAWKRTIFRKSSADRHFYETVLGRMRPLDSVLVKDERILERFEAPFVWMPEIFQYPKTSSNALSESEAEAAHVIDRASADMGGRLLLFYGTGTWYKGYDYFLRLAETDKSCMALHIGAPERSEPGKRMAFDTNAIRNHLRHEGRLVETGIFASEYMTRKAFDAISCFVSFHRLSGTSGTTLQALAAGKPVVTPNAGLLGVRTRRHALGLTYSPYCETSLQGAWKEMQRVPLGRWRASITSFMDHFSQEAVARLFASLVETGVAPASHRTP